jgi:hypothetical protein
VIFKAILEVCARKDPFLSITQIHQVFSSWVKLDKNFTGQLPVQSYIKFLFQLGHPLGVKDMRKPHLKDRRNNQLFNEPGKDFFHIMDRVSRFNIKVYRDKKGKFHVHFVDFVTLLCGSIVATATRQALQQYSTHRVRMLIDIWKKIFKNYSKVELFQQNSERKDKEFKSKHNMVMKQPLITYDLLNFLTINRLVFRIKNYMKKNRFMKKQILQSSISRQIQNNHMHFMMKRVNVLPNGQSFQQLHCPMHSEGIFRDFYLNNNDNVKEQFSTCICKQSESPPNETKRDQDFNRDSDSQDKNYSVYSSKGVNQTKVVYVFPNFKS